MLARALTGLAAGTLSTCSITFAADWFPYQVRGRAIGLISSAYFAAPILGVPIAAQIADRFGWRRAFLVLCTPWRWSLLHLQPCAYPLNA